MADFKLQQTGEEVQELLNKVTENTQTIEELGNNTYKKNEVDVLLDGKTNSMISIVHADLVALRDNGQLIPGQFYRITDFVTTVDTTTNPDARSAGHQFDVIVRADSTTVLNENAYAAVHEGDSYFASCKLNAWKVWYAIDNDTDRFDWADAENGKGVIYRLIDEYNNDCPYDFKNVQFKRWAITDITSENNVLNQEELYSLKSDFCYDQNGGKCYDLMNIYKNHINLLPLIIQYDEETYMFYYTFQGISKRNNSDDMLDYYDMSTHPLKLSNGCMDYLDGDSSSYSPADICRNNTIKPNFSSLKNDDVSYDTKHYLNNIVFLGTQSYCYYDESDDSWYYKTGIIMNNQFQENCTDITLSGDPYNNTFKQNCNSIILGDYSSDNTFINTHSCIFSNSCSKNTLDNNTFSVLINSTCIYLGEGCAFNVLGMVNNSEINKYCSNNKFTYCGNLIINNECSYNKLNLVSGCIFDGYISSITINNTSSYYIKNIHVLSGISNVSLPFDSNKTYTQYAGLDSNGDVVIWSPADNVQNALN
jgi:hypothetical protein